MHSFYFQNIWGIEGNRNTVHISVTSISQAMSRALRTNLLLRFLPNSWWLPISISGSFKHEIQQLFILKLQNKKTFCVV